MRVRRYRAVRFENDVNHTNKNRSLLKIAI